jgi:hypothetical protein
MWGGVEPGACPGRVVPTHALCACAVKFLPESAAVPVMCVLGLWMSSQGVVDEVVKDSGGWWFPFVAY